MCVCPYVCYMLYEVTVVATGTNLSVCSRDVALLVVDNSANDNFKLWPVDRLCRHAYQDTKFISV